MNKNVFGVPRMRIGKKGITLIASIMLIVFASVAVLGVTTFIIQRLNLFEAKRIHLNSIYLAEAGINQAVYKFRFNDLATNGYFSLGKTNVDTGNFFVLGASDSDLLMVNTSVSNLQTPNNRDLINLTIQNSTNSRSITIDRMAVTWNNSRKLKVIRINNSNVWNGNSSSPVNANITNFTLNAAPSIYSVNYLRFNDDMSEAVINIKFIMSDGSNKTVTVYPASNRYLFTIKSTGKSTDSNIYRTIQADYNVLTSKIEDYHEVNDEITP